ncbi:gliding motility-associated ABC transporter substrate-binding protein GldG [Flavobacterium gelidilacus]|jgi:gliding-associated putative ABC transporter substrate-binding component GldG|uniref:gliding motility-associated ABC transporter substrate-binding protein GldG n=1 Tax=Flavobacterium gelidilacus TaxID=206041 RepID=UPI00040F59A6|nr:gliding motility-associated ABC transporter substrate-binding protein GldG [Flavobacterium gelidilacus]
MEANKKNSLKQLGITAAILLAINIFGNYFFKRFDLTKDKRYTLSETTLGIIESVDSPLYIDVFLEGKFPPEFKRLQNETRQLLEEFTAYNSNIIFQFVNPIEKEEERVEVMKNFYERGLMPLSITVEDKGKQSQEVVFPWAVATYGDKSTKVGLLKNLMGATTEEKVISSVQHMEFAFADALNKITKQKQKKIAVLKGNGELDDLYIADFLKTVRESYYIGTFTLDSLANKPIETIEALQKYDMAIIAKPTIAFSDEEKQVIDQFIVNGGKTLWLVDAVKADMDSLFTQPQILAYPLDLNLTDQLFQYGLRVNGQLVKDEQATPIKLATGQEGSQTQYQEFSWRFSPFVYPASNHPIVKNMEGIKFEFANPIEILKNDIKKTVLLTSSAYSKPVGTPLPIALDLVTEETKPTDYPNGGLLPMAILLEGKFKSVYKNRVLPIKDSKFKDIDKESKMIFISDGDVIKNQIDKDGYPMELGFDKFTNQLYGNKEFLMNCVNYLLDDNGLINIRSKDVDLPLLDKEKVYENYTFAQIITIGLPLALLGLFGFLFTYLRKRKYVK